MELTLDCVPQRRLDIERFGCLETLKKLQYPIPSRVRNIQCELQRPSKCAKIHITWGKISYKKYAPGLQTHNCMFIRSKFTIEQEKAIRLKIWYSACSIYIYI